MLLTLCMHARLRCCKPSASAPSFYIFSVGLQYVSEAVAAISEANVKTKDIAAAVEVRTCTARLVLLGM